MKRQGRKRKMVKRTPSGQPSRAGQSIVNPQALAHRAALVGNENAKDPNAGHALGVLMLRGIITPRQCDAGLAFARFYRSWQCMAGSNIAWDGTANHRVKNDVSPEDWQKACELFKQIKTKIDQAPASLLVRGAIETFVIENMLPPVVEAELRHTSATGGVTRMMYAKAIQALIAGLDILDAFFLGGQGR